jgi:hypothetical protein
MEVDLALDAASTKDNAVVWRSITTAIILNPRRTRGGPSPKPAGQVSERVITFRVQVVLRCDTSQDLIHSVELKHQMSTALEAKILQTLKFSVCKCKKSSELREPDTSGCATFKEPLDTLHKVCT